MAERIVCCALALCDDQRWRKARFAIGVEGLFEDDLARLNRSYQVTENGIGTRLERPETRTIGTSKLGAVLTLGGSFGL